MVPQKGQTQTAKDAWLSLLLVEARRPPECQSNGVD
jgi:hypothetical protein